MRAGVDEVGVLEIYVGEKDQVLSNRGDVIEDYRHTVYSNTNRLIVENRLPAKVRPRISTDTSYPLI